MRVVFGFVLILGIALAGFAVYLANGYVNSYRVALAKAKGAEGIATVEVFVATKRMNYGDKLDKDAVAPCPITSPGTSSTKRPRTGCAKTLSPACTRAATA